MGNGDAHKRLQRPLTQKKALLGPWLVWPVQIAAQLCMFVVPRAGIENLAIAPLSQKSGGISLGKNRPQSPPPAARQHCAA